MFPSNNGFIIGGSPPIGIVLINIRKDITSPYTMQDDTFQWALLHYNSSLSIYYIILSVLPKCEIIRRDSLQTLHHHISIAKHTSFRKRFRLSLSLSSNIGHTSHESWPGMYHHLTPTIHDDNAYFKKDKEIVHWCRS